MSGERYNRPGENGAGYFSGSGNQFREIGTIALAGAVTETASTNGPAIEVGDKGDLRLLLNVSAASGSAPTLDIAVQTSKDNSSWRAVGTFTQATGTTSERKSFTGIDRFVRYVSTIGGSSPSFTYTIDGEAV